MAYLKLAVAQKKTGFYAEAIQKFTFYLMATPDAKIARDVKNKVDELMRL